MKNKKGFTLIELLAVIVILGIILVIAIPSISAAILNSRKNAYVATANEFVDGLRMMMLTDASLLPTNEESKCVPISDIKLEKGSNTKSPFGKKYASDSKVCVKYEESKKDYTYSVCLIDEGGNGLSSNDVLNLSKSDVKIGNANCSENEIDVSEYDEFHGVNKPKLIIGMTPIIWNGSDWIETTKNNPNWYNYNSKQWANAKTEDGSMWVWIPRFIYTIKSGWHSSSEGNIEIQFSKNFDDDWNSNVIGNIETDKTANSSNNKWTNHPAFTFGETELTGFWIAKFEASPKTGVSNNAAGDNTPNKEIELKPNKIAWRYVAIGNAFKSTRNMEINPIYGWGNSGEGLDTHLVKNVEWGAIVYLAKSQYGTDLYRVWTNPTSQFITGCAGDSEQAINTSTCINSYETVNGVKASTTGNIYGVYDMVGGSWEMVMGNYANISGASEINLLDIEDKYIDRYTQYSNIYYGDALYETSNVPNSNYCWYTIGAFFPTSKDPWFYRGGGNSTGFGAVLFVFKEYDGGPYIWYGFRPTLLINESL